MKKLDFKPCYYSVRLLDKIKQLNKNTTQKVDVSEIEKAIYYAKKYHGNQKRQTGEVYYAHPLEVAYLVANYTATIEPRFYQTHILVTAILHDTIEDTELTEKLIAEIFGDCVATQVESLSRNKAHGKISSKETLNLLVSQDRADTIMIKLFDRIDNLQTVSIKKPEKAQKIIDETLEAFVPVAAQLNMKVIEKQLKDLCDKYPHINRLLPQYLENSLNNNSCCI